MFACLGGSLRGEGRLGQIGEQGAQALANDVGPAFEFPAIEPAIAAEIIDSGPGESAVFDGFSNRQKFW